MKGLSLKLATLALATLLMGVTMSKADTGGQPPLRDSASVDTTSQHSLTRADSVRVVKHQFNHREQIIAGSVIMACLAGIIVVMNNYNPR